MSERDAERGAQIERFYFFLMRLAGIAGGWLCVVGGLIFALAFGLEWLRTGQIAFNGSVHTSAAALWRLIGIPLLFAAAGLALALWLRRERTEPER